MVDAGRTGRRPIALHSSWSGLAVSAVGPLLLAALGLYGIVVGGLQVINGFIFTVGAVLLIIVIFDFPIWTRFDESGVTRHCLLRRQHLSWSRVRTIARPASRGAFGGKRASKSGLTAEIGRRPILLVDKIESAHEHEALSNAVRDWAPAVAFRASKPASGIAPTWMYKRRRGVDATALVDEL